jgi:hypothetical protein
MVWLSASAGGVTVDHSKPVAFDGDPLAEDQLAQQRAGDTQREDPRREFRPAGAIVHGQEEVVVREKHLNGPLRVGAGGSVKLRVLAATDALGVPGVLDVVRKQIILIDRHRSAADDSLRRKLAAAQMRWLEFGSWIADNQQQPDTAGRWLKAARSLADDAGDHVSDAYLQMRQAQQAIEASESAGSAALAEPVMRDHTLPPRVRALAAVRYAQAMAHDRDVSGVRAGLGLAHHLIDQASRAEDPAVTAMAGHGTGAYLRGYEAHCRLLLGDAPAAARDLQLVLTDWPATQRLDEGLFRANRAVALARSGELEAAEVEAAAARTLGIQTGSRRTLAMLDGLADARTHV